MDNATLLTMYGRAFEIAPILGRLGYYVTMDDFAKDVASFSTNLAKVNGSRKIVPVVHLIYALAMPCRPTGDCLFYLEDAKEKILDWYIKPAQDRGYLVILDTQHGRSSSVAQVQRMIDKGYLAYDNVHVALDPEFRLVKSDQALPGQPIGTIPVEDVNDVQSLLDTYVKDNNLKHKKIVMVHQFGDSNIADAVPNMIRDKKNMKTYPNVDLMLCADGFGGPDAELAKYNKITDSTVYPFVRYRSIKLFLEHSESDNKRIDKPAMTFRMCFGLDAAPHGTRALYEPDAIVIA